MTSMKKISSCACKRCALYHQCSFRFWVFRDIVCMYSLRDISSIVSSTQSSRYCVYVSLRLYIINRLESEVIVDVCVYVCAICRVDALWELRHEVYWRFCTSRFSCMFECVIVSRHARSLACLFEDSWSRTMLSYCCTVVLRIKSFRFAMNS